LALLVIAATQPWSAAGAEKPMMTLVPGAAFALLPCWLLTWVLSEVLLLVQAVSRAPAPTVAVPKRILLRGQSGHVFSQGGPGGR
jgi:hypothetical protein